MGKRKDSNPRKRRTREHVIADLSVNYVERFALKCGHAVERVMHDYGLDMLVFTYTAAGKAENGLIGLQLKATDSLQLRKDRRAVIVRVERAHLLSWLNEAFPVILIVYDAVRERAYWLYIQGELEGGRVFRMQRKGETISLHLPIRHVVNEAAMRQFVRFKAAWLAGEAR